MSRYSGYVLLATIGVALFLSILLLGVTLAQQNIPCRELTHEFIYPTRCAVIWELTTEAER